MAIGAVENVLLVGWLGDPDRSSAEALRDTTNVLRSRYPDGIAHLNVVAKSSRPQTFDEPSRKIIIDMLHDTSLRMCGSVTVYGGGGFVAATIRGVLASLTMLTRIPVKIRFVATVEEAEPLLRKELGAHGAPVPLPGVLVRGYGELVADAQRDGFEF